MPNYQFTNSKGEIVEHYFAIQDAPPIGSTIKIGRAKFTRIPSDTQVAVDTRIDPFSKQKFLDKTNKPGTLGSLQDQARELHEKRKQQTGGQDQIKDSFIESSKKTRRGKVYIDKD